MMFCAVYDTSLPSTQIITSEELSEGCVTTDGSSVLVNSQASQEVP